MALLDSALRIEVGLIVAALLVVVAAGVGSTFGLDGGWAPVVGAFVVVVTVLGLSAVVAVTR